MIAKAQGMTFEDEVDLKIRLERRLTARVSRIFLEIRRQFRAEFEALGTIPALRPYQDALHAELETHYRVVQGSFAEVVPQQMDVTVPEEARAVIAAGLAYWIARRTPFQADRIITTVRRRFERAIAAATAAVQEQMPNQPPPREAVGRTAANIMAPQMRRQAVTVGETETQPAAESTKSITAFALAGLVVAGTFGMTPVPPEKAKKSKKFWLSKRDERVRPWHVEEDGQIQDFDVPYTVGGELLMYPGDTDLGATLPNIVNCRCSSRYIAGT